MRKGMVLLWIALFVLICFSLTFAANLGPIRPLGNKKISIGIENDNTISRPLKAKIDISGANIKESSRDSMLIGLGITEHLNIFTRLGAAVLSERLKWGDIGTEQTINYKYGFFWGLGANAHYNLKKNFGLGLDVQFDTSTNRAKSISGSINPVLDTKSRITIYETQIAPYITYDIKVKENIKLMPYLGGYYSFYSIPKGLNISDGDYIYTTNDEKLRGKNHLGILGGFEMLFFKQLALKIEGRFLAETAVSTSLNYKF